MHDHVVHAGAGRQRIHLQQRIERIDQQHVRRSAIGGQRGVVNLHGLVVIEKLRAGRLGHPELRGDSRGQSGGGDRADRAQHAVAVGLHHLVEKRAELRHGVFHFALGGVLDGFLRRIRGVFHQLGDFHGVPEKYRRHLGHVVERAGTAAQVAAVHIGQAGLASWTNLQRQPHVARADAFNVAALLDHGQQDVVALVKQRKLVADFFELQRDGLCILHLCHGLNFSLGMDFVSRG